MDTFGDIVDTLRTDVLRDVVAPYLWRDEFLYRCVAQAHDEFAEATLLLRDTASDLTRVALAAGEDTYPLDERVVAVVSGRIEGDAFDLARAGHTLLNTTTQPADTLAWLESLTAAPQTGRPRAFSTDEGVDGDGAAAVLRVYPTPTAAEVGLALRLRVARLPLVRCGEATLNAVPECPRQYRWALVHGAAAIAYNVQDADAADPAAAAKHRTHFDEFVARAKGGVRTKMQQPMRWGFNSPR